MKKLFCIFLILVSLPVMATPDLSQDQKLASLCQVWGFLKYYHPEVAKGKLDWDAALIQKIPEVMAAKDQAALNDIYDAWLQGLGKVKRCRSCKNDVKESQTKNLDLKWINSATVFTPEITQKLNYIRQNRIQGKNFYVEHRYRLFKTQASFRNEKKYAGMDYPTAEYRLLTLFRYWNIVNYFFPYKYVIGEDWNNVLLDMLPQFKEAPNPTDYHLAILELTGRVNDSHSWYGNKYTFEAMGYYSVPFQFKIIDTQAVVTGFYNDSLAQQSGLQVGDAINKIDGKTIGEVLTQKLKYFGASNYPTQLHKASNMSFNIFSGPNKTVALTFNREGAELNKVINRYLPGRDFKNKKEIKPAWQLLNPEIGYVNMGVMQGQESTAMLAAFKNTEGIIIDLRKNLTPSATHAMLSHMHQKKVTYAHLDYPNLSYPGVFNRKKAWKAGKNNKNYYRGKVVLLFDENTQSIGEFNCMAFQTLPNVIGIGSQTAGADGNIMLIDLPGGYKTSITGLGVYYPDGRETQRIGIVPDIEVKPTLAGIKLGKDEVLERAITYLQTGK